MPPKNKESVVSMSRATRVAIIYVKRFGELDVALTVYDPSIPRGNLQQRLLFEP